MSWRNRDGGSGPEVNGSTVRGGYRSKLLKRTITRSLARGYRLSWQTKWNGYDAPRLRCGRMSKTQWIWRKSKFCRRSARRNCKSGQASRCRTSDAKDVHEPNQSTDAAIRGPDPVIIVEHQERVGHAPTSPTERKAPRWNALAGGCGDEDRKK